MRKIFLAVFLPIAIIVGGIVVLIYNTETKSKLSITKTKESGYLKLQVKTTTDIFHHIISDLMLLDEQQRELQKAELVFEYNKTLSRINGTFSASL